MPRIYAFDVLKIFGALGISLLHFNWRLIPQGYLFVEMFFIMSGFCLYLHLSSYANKTLFEIFIKRLQTFYFYYLMVMLLQIILSEEFPPLYLLVNAAFFLGNLGFGIRWGYGALWFLPVYLLSFMFYVSLFKIISVKKALLIVWCIVFLSLWMVYNYSPAHNLNMVNEVTCGIFQLGILRGVIGIGLGILTAAVTLNFKQTEIIKIAGILSFFFLINIIFRSATTNYDFISYIVFCTIISWCYIYSNLGNTIFEKLGKPLFYFCSLSLPVYVFHMFIVDLLIKAFNTTDNTPPIIYLIIVVLFAAAMKALYKKLLCLFNKFRKGTENEY